MKFMHFFKTKRCFQHKKKTPLFMFYKNNRKYQREDMLGRVFVCRICSANNLIRESKHMKLYNDKKFEVEYVKPSLLNWIKKFLNLI